MNTHIQRDGTYLPACTPCTEDHKARIAQRIRDNKEARRIAREQRQAKKQERQTLLAAGTVLLYYGNDPGSIPHHLTVLETAHDKRSNLRVAVNTGTRTYQTKMRTARLLAMPTYATTTTSQERAEC